MNARYYLAGVGRFISADTLIPNPTNPQSYNRYSYVRNSPLNFTDPTGHAECNDDCSGSQPHEIIMPPPPPSIADQVQQGSNIYGIIFEADEGEAWTDEQMEAILSAAKDIEYRFRLQGNYGGYAPGAIWKEIFGTITMWRSSKTEWTDSAGNKHPIDYGAETFTRTIEVYDVAIDGVSLSSFGKNMVHEFGHAFNATTVIGTDTDPYSTLGVDIGSGVLPLRNFVRDGMPPYPDQQSPYQTTNGELFADMFLNWTYQSFLNNPQGSLEKNWMNSQMSTWAER